MTSWPDLVAFALQFDGVALSQSYGEPSLKIGKALLTRHRVADNSIVLKSIDPDERDLLLAKSPKLFFLEDHYAGHDIVLARLQPAELHHLAPFIARTWRALASKRKIAAYDNRHP